MSGGHIKIAIISDVHAATASSEHARGTNVLVPAPLSRPNPVVEIKKLISDRKIEADYLICPGDITNQADHDAFVWMWAELKEIGKLLKAREVHATCGNHDLDSRYLSSRNDDDPDAKGAILALDDRFPALSVDDHSHYWAHNYVILERRDPKPHRVVLLNTCAYHGTKPDEIDHGRISGRTISAVRRSLKGRSRTALNIVVCHHHLAPLQSWGARSDYEYAMKGGELIQTLEEACLGPWIIIHGHRHWPDCIYASGGAGSPVVFCSGSFGKADAEISNQFHLLEIELNQSAARPRGKVRTWSWTISSSWSPSEHTDAVKALTHKSGFGYAGSLPELEDAVESAIDSSSQAFLDWTSLVEQLPELDYLLPRDFRLVRRNLKERGIRIHMEDGVPLEIAKRREVR